MGHSVMHPIEPLAAAPGSAKDANPNLPAHVWTALSRPALWHDCAPCMRQQAASGDDDPGT